MTFFYQNTKNSYKVRNLQRHVKTLLDLYDAHLRKLRETFAYAKNSKLIF